MIEHAQPVLLVDSSPELMTLVQQWLTRDRLNRPFLVLPQHLHVRQYLHDATHAGRQPALLILRAGPEPVNDPSIALLHWLRTSPGGLGRMPVLIIGDSPPVIPTPLTRVVSPRDDAQLVAALVDALLPLS